MTLFYPSALLFADLATGNRTVSSNPSNGRGPRLRWAGEVILDGSRALIVDAFLQAVFAVDTLTGERVLLSF